MRKARQGSRGLEEATRAWGDRAGPDAGPEQSTGPGAPQGSPPLPPRAQHDAHLTEEETESAEGGDVPGVTERKPSPAALAPALRPTAGTWGSRPGSEREAGGELGAGGQSGGEKHAGEQGCEVAPGSVGTRRGLFL